MSTSMRESGDFGPMEFLTLRRPAACAPIGHSRLTAYGAEEWSDRKWAELTEILRISLTNKQCRGRLGEESAGLLCAIVFSRCQTAVERRHGLVSLTPKLSLSPSKEPDMLRKIFDHILEGNALAASECVEKALAAGLDPAVILNQAMIAAMDETGRRFEAGDIYVPEMLVAGRAMQSALGALKPFLVEADLEPLGKVVIGTVKGDLHDIGKNLVALMLQGAGFEVIDLGTDVSPAGFVQAVGKHQPLLVAMSALLTTTMANMSATIKALQDAGLRDRVRVMVGGAPVTRQFADQVGADMYEPDAASAARAARLAAKEGDSV